MSDNIRPTLAVMAAGLGQRYKGLKQLVPINGYLLLEYSIFDALREDFGKVVILIREDFENDFRRYKDRMIEGAKNFNAVVECAYQPSLDKIKQEYPFRKKMWGTGYAALCFKDAIQEPAAFINADNFYGRKPFEVLCKFFNDPSYDPNGDVHALVGYRLKNVVHSKKPVAEAICTISSKGFLESIIERTEIKRKGDSFVYCGDNREYPLDPDVIVSATFWGFNPTIFPKLKNGFEKFLQGINLNREPKKEFYIPDLVNELIAERGIKVKVLPIEEQCFGMTYKEEKDLIQTEMRKLLNKGKYPNKLRDVNID